MLTGVFAAEMQYAMQREGDADLHVTSRGIRTLVKLPALTSLSLGGRCLVTDETLSALRCMGQVRVMCMHQRGCTRCVDLHFSPPGLRHQGFLRARPQPLFIPPHPKQMRFVIR